MARGRLLERGWAVHGAMIALVIFWGLAFIAIKQALVHMSWVTLTFLRFAIADLRFVVYLLAVPQARVSVDRKHWPMLTLLAFLGLTGYHLLVNLGESDPNTTAGTTALIIASAPAFIAVLAVPLLKERLRPLQAAGIALAFAGLAVMVVLASPTGEYSFHVSAGSLAVLPAAIFAAVFAVLGKGYLREYRPFVFVAWCLFLGTLLTVPLVVATAGEFVADLQGLTWEGVVPVLFLGVFPTFVAYGIWFRGLERMPAAAAGAYVYLSTLVAVVGGVWILGETITGAGILGGAMVIAGVVLAQQLGRRQEL